MNKERGKKAAVYSALTVLTAFSVLTASIMAGCGSSDGDTKTTSIITETQIVTEIVDVTNTVSTGASAANGSSSSSAAAGGSSSQAERSENDSSESSNSESSAKSESSAQSGNSASSSSSSSGKSSSSSSSGHVSTDILTVDGNKYYVGDTFTCTIRIKTPDKIENYQGTFSYDSKYLECTGAELCSPASSGGIVNYKSEGVVHFNGSSAITGYNYTGGGDLLTLTFKAKAEGSVTPTLSWKTVRQLTTDSTGTNYAESGLESEVIYN